MRSHTPGDQDRIKRLEIRPPAAVSIGTRRKGKGRTGSATHGSFSLFQTVLKRRVYDKNKNNHDNRPQESILFSALSGLINGVHLNPPAPTFPAWRAGWRWPPNPGTRARRGISVGVAVRAGRTSPGGPISTDGSGGGRGRGNPPARL